MANSSHPSYAWLLFVFHFIQGPVVPIHSAHFSDTRKFFFYLLFGSNSLLAGVVNSYTHVYCAFALCVFVLTLFLQALLLRMRIDTYSACFSALNNSHW